MGEFSLQSLVYVLQISGYQAIIHGRIAPLSAHARAELLSPEITATCCFSWQIKHKELIPWTQAAAAVKQGHLQ